MFSTSPITKNRKMNDYPDVTSLKDIVNLHFGKKNRIQEYFSQESRGVKQCLVHCKTSKFDISSLQT